MKSTIYLYLHLSISFSLWYISASRCQGLLYAVKAVIQHFEPNTRPVTLLDQYCILLLMVVDHGDSMLAEMQADTP